MKSIFSEKKLNIALQRMAREIIEHHGSFEKTALIGIQPRGVFFAHRIHRLLKELMPDTNIPYGTLDITFYRDDFQNKTEIFLPEDTALNFSIEGKNIILIDDVLFTGRTIRSAMDALVDFGRPALVELMVLIDRRFSRELPIQADYVGMHVDSIAAQKVKVNWKENEGKDEVIML